MRGMRWAGVALLVVVVGAASGAWAAEGITAEQLVYQGATVETQVDVNGAAAVQLVGGVVDALAAQVQEQVKAMQMSGAAAPQSGPAAVLPMVLPMVAPMQDAIKSLERITLVVMKPQGEVKVGEFISYYSGLMSAQGWSPLMTVRDKDRTGVVMMMAPEAKGVFFAVNDKGQLVSGLVTTTKPMGEVLGQLINASGGAWPMIMSKLNRPEPAPQVTAVSAKPKPAPAKTPPKRR
jgi:hypothetical protein